MWPLATTTWLKQDRGSSGGGSVAGGTVGDGMCPERNDPLLSSAPVAAVPVQRVTIRAVHGSLECAGRHVLVGHFLGTPIGGAEGFLDERLGRRLSSRQLLGQYPERVGEWIVVDAPGRELGNGAGYPPGGLVIGLDLPGELTREKLTAAVSEALVGRGVARLEERISSGSFAGEPEQLMFSAVAVGTGGVGAMSVESCVAGIVDGVVAANEMLHSHTDPRTGARAWDHLRIADLEILEVLADKAEQVAHAVRRTEDLLQVEAGDHTELVLADQLVEGEGGLPASVAAPAQTADWQRVIIRDVGREQPGGESLGEEEQTAGSALLEFTAIGRRARAERMQVTIDRRSVESLVDGAVRDARPGAQVGNTLYELLLPPDLKSDLARSENVQFIVDKHTADFPWEALSARMGGRRRRELALRGGFLRQFRETEGARTGIRAPVGEHALVIGNPPAGGAMPTLPGAREEAEAVAAILEKQGFDVSALVWDEDGSPSRGTFPDFSGTPGRQVLDAMFSHDWRIVHIAAHGRFDAADSSRSGVVVDGETSVTPNVVRQLPVVPELVFLNCCHLGRVAEDRGPEPANRLAASVARELMRIGVRAVVAAGWAIDDVAAVMFARTFYDELLAGRLFGSAVQIARQRVHKEFAPSHTWAAFQCYGDPGYRLRSSQAPAPEPPAMVSSDELMRRVRTIQVLAGKIGLPDFEDISRRENDLVDELDRWRRGLAERGWEKPVVLYEMGVAYGELGRYGQAVECFRRAWDDDVSNTAPMKLLEQLGNFEARRAQGMARKHPAAPEVPGLLAAAEEHLRLALGLGETTERLALLGSFHKKAAAMSAGEQRHHHLVEAAGCYRRAHNLHCQRCFAPEPYFTLNWLQMASLAGAPIETGEAEALLVSVEAGASRPEKEDFWTRATLANLALTRAVLGGSNQFEDVEPGYRWAFATRSSRRHRDSVIDHIRDLADLVDGSELERLADRLTAGEQ